VVRQSAILAVSGDSVVGVVVTGSLRSESKTVTSILRVY
jgi:hypothetical protein